MHRCIKSESANRKQSAGRETAGSREPSISTPRLQQQRRALAQRARAVQIIGRGHRSSAAIKLQNKQLTKRSRASACSAKRARLSLKYLITLRATTTAAGGQRQQVRLTRRRASEDGRWRTSEKPQMTARWRFTARSSSEPLPVMSPLSRIQARPRLNLLAPRHDLRRHTSQWIRRAGPPRLTTRGRPRAAADAAPPIES